MILIGSTARDHLSITISRWLIDEPDNPVDAAWLVSEIEIAAGPFRGRFETQLRREDVVSWRDDLALLDREFRPGLARFSPTLEHAVVFVVTVGNTGALSVDGWAAPAIGSAAKQRLEFSFPIDQSVRELLTPVEAYLHGFHDRAEGLE